MHIYIYIPKHKIRAGCNISIQPPADVKRIYKHMYIHVYIYMYNITHTLPYSRILSFFRFFTVLLAHFLTLSLSPAGFVPVAMYVYNRPHYLEQVLTNLSK